MRKKSAFRKAPFIVTHVDWDRGFPYRPKRRRVSRECLSEADSSATLGRTALAIRGVESDVRTLNLAILLRWTPVRIPSVCDTAWCVRYRASWLRRHDHPSPIEALAEWRAFQPHGAAERAGRLA
jgi:hypothetical protein